MKRARGSIDSRGPGTWRIRAMVDGDRRCETVHGTKRQAESRLNALIAEMEAEADKVSNPTVSAFWEDFTASCEAKGLATSTIAGYESVYRNHIGPALGGERVDHVTPRMVSALLGSLPSGSARHVKAVLSAMFSLAEERELVDSSVMRRKYTLPAASVRKVNRDVLGMDALLRIADEAEGEPWEAYFLTMAFAGLRREEAAALRPEDVREYRGRVVIDVRRTYQIVDGVGVFGEGKTAGSVRTAVMVERGERLLELCDEAGTWLTERDGMIANPNTVSKQWEAWFKGRPMAYVPMRNLRNSFSTAMMAAGMDSAMVSKLTGHASLDVQYRHYLRPAADDFIDAIGPTLVQRGGFDWSNGASSEEDLGI